MFFYKNMLTCLSVFILNKGSNMLRKLTLITCWITLFSLTACTHILKPWCPPIQQGNIITTEMTQKLKIGMNKKQVTDIFGEPILTNPFDPEVWTYVYTF